MRASLRAAVLGVSLLALSPIAADAAPILHSFDATVGAGPETFSGSFLFDNDVALIRFVLGEGTFNLNAATTSYADLDVLGFDPYVALYYGTERVTYVNADGEPTLAENDDTVSGLDALLALTLSGVGEYTLALAHSGNFSHEEFLTFEWDAFPNATEELLGVICDPPGLGLECRMPNFSVDLELTQIDAEHVPEPGTLSLLALGAAGSALLRRRRARRLTNTP